MQQPSIPFGENEFKKNINITLTVCLKQVPYYPQLVKLSILYGNMVTGYHGNMITRYLHGNFLLSLLISSGKIGHIPLNSHDRHICERLDKNSFPMLLVFNKGYVYSHQCIVFFGY